MNDQTSLESQELFNLIVENVKDYAIFATDAEGHVISWNPGVKRLLGYDEAEIVGQSITLIFTPEDREQGAHLREMETAAREGRAEDQRWHMRKDGARFWANGLVMPLREEGELRGFAKVMRDDTARKRLEDERKELLAHAEEGKRQAEEANRVKDVFLATLSHELRTPLTAILGWTRMISEGQLDEVASARALKTVERNAKAQLQLIEDILDISRVIAGKLRLNRRTTELTEAINAAVETMRPAAEAKHITIETNLDSSASLVSGDPERLQQVMTNLLSNAIKFTPDGGHVTVKLGRADSRARITVSDTGKGIAGDVLPHIFDLFRQADSSATRRHGGLGIGLALVQHIVELHKGTVVAESAGEGHGATFTVNLPPLAVRRKPTGKETARTMGEDELPVDFTPLLRGLRLLLVEDEEDALLLISSMLEHYGAQVTAVTSAGEALEWLAGSQPDVIISDIGLPDEDGLSFMRKVRALEAGRGGRIPSVALTAYAGTEDRTRTLLAGFQVHVAKPVEPMELAAVVASLAGRTGVS